MSGNPHRPHKPYRPALGVTSTRARAMGGAPRAPVRPSVHPDANPARPGFTVEGSVGPCEGPGQDHDEGPAEGTGQGPMGVTIEEVLVIIEKTGGSLHLMSAPSPARGWVARLAYDHGNDVVWGSYRDTPEEALEEAARASVFAITRALPDQFKITAGPVGGLSWRLVRLADAGQVMLVRPNIKGPGHWLTTLDDNQGGVYTSANRASPNAAVTALVQHLANQPQSSLTQAVYEAEVEVAANPEPIGPPDPSWALAKLRAEVALDCAEEAAALADLQIDVFDGGESRPGRALAELAEEAVLACRCTLETIEALKCRDCDRPASE